MRKATEADSIAIVSVDDLIVTMGKRIDSLGLVLFLAQVPQKQIEIQRLVGVNLDCCRAFFCAQVLLCLELVIEYRVSAFRSIGMLRSAQLYTVP